MKIQQPFLILFPFLYQLNNVVEIRKNLSLVESIMPSASFVQTDGADSNIRGGHAEARTRNVGPLVDSGSLNAYLHRDLTPVIGREYEGLQVKYLIEADQQLIHDLAVTSQYRQLFRKTNLYSKNH